MTHIAPSLRGLMLALVLTVLALARCAPGRDALLGVTPGVPPPSGCATNTYRCNNGVPEACSASGRWWPALPRDATGGQTRCPAGCAVNGDGVAHCAAADGGAR